MLQTHTSPRRAFALIELVIILAIVLVAMLICALALPDARRRARLVGSIHNLQQIGANAHAYAADNNNRIFSFTWEPAPTRSCDGYIFPSSANSVDAATDQAVCIMRRRGNRPDIGFIRSWTPHILYNHLVLLDYLNEDLPSPRFVSPGDAPRLAWLRAGVIASSDPADQGQAFFRLAARPAGVGNSMQRWPYSTSYQMPPAFFGPDARIGSISTFQQDSSSHRAFNVPSPGAVLGNRRMDEIAFASQKVMMFETAQRFFGNRELWFAAAESRAPVLLSDGGASVQSSSRANPGFYPNVPSNAGPTRINYQPELSWEPPTSNGAFSEFVNGIYLWTRSGLRGRDFNGPEVPWVP